jgi:N-acetyl sugar amidotransferase
MDTTDSAISFNAEGICDYCINYEKKILSDSNSYSNEELQKIVQKIKRYGRNKTYDCVIGLSGGADSSYLVYYAKEILGLRPLIYSVDTGWNLNVAVENIEKIVKKLNLDLFTEVIDWHAMQDLQRSFFLSNLPYQDLPQDHVIFAGIYNYAIKNDIKYVLTGSNNSTEGVRPPIEWVYFNDLKLIRSVHRKFGKVPLKSLPLASMLKYKIFYEFVLGMKRFYPLDYLNYNKEEAEKLLAEKFDWKKYDNKHYENIFTRFYEGYYLIKKFGFDKRRCYLSNLIITNQITREEGMELILKNPYDIQTAKRDQDFIAKKLNFSPLEFDNLINSPGKNYKDYPNDYFLLKLMIKIAQLLGIEKREFR